MDEQPVNYDSTVKPCDVCGNSEFTWGKMYAGKGLEHDLLLWFRPSDASPEDGDYVTDARYCKQCGNIKLFGYIV